MTKRMLLAEAISRHVRPGMHLNFASTPGRSNVAIRALARQFWTSDPGFVLSTTGFHSTAHLLGLLRLGKRYIGCFFGDNYPVPRPSPLYQQLLREGAAIESWSLWTYVSALRAGALGHPYAVTGSLQGTTLGAQLARAGKFVEIPDPADPERRVGLVAAMTPDVVFLHAPAGDEEGHALWAPPVGEGFHGALAARRGVIITVDRLVEPATIRSARHLVPIPPQRVLAICEEPFGAHPQPLPFVPAQPPLPSYHDDFEHYRLWREMARDPDLFEQFCRRVLDAPDHRPAYRSFVGEARLEALRDGPGTSPAVAPRTTTAPAAPRAPTGAERLVLLAARTIARRVREGRHQSILAGIGQSFAAARLAKLILSEEESSPVEVLIETGLCALDVRAAHPFLLSHQNTAAAGRLSSIEGVLGTLVCGAQNACLGVLGAAQVDVQGNLNSTFVGDELLVGSGGAADIAASAREVVVLARADRLVTQVDYITSPGARVSCVVTEDCVLERPAAGGPWTVREVFEDGLAGLATLVERCRWPCATPLVPRVAPAPTALERTFLAEAEAAP